MQLQVIYRFLLTLNQNEATKGSSVAKLEIRSKCFVPNSWGCLKSRGSDDCTDVVKAFLFASVQ